MSSVEHFKADCVLYVDLDGTLVRSDTFLDTLCALARKHPLALLKLPLWLMRGLAHTKKEVAQLLVPDPAHWPYVEPLLDFLRQEKKRSRKLILATASNEKVAQAVADHLGLFDGILASDGTTNRRAHAKLEEIRRREAGAPFAYAGNSRDDLVLWAEAAECILVNPPAKVLRAAQHMGAKIRTHIDDKASAGASALRSMRVYQWAKNALIFVSLILSHKLFDSALATQTALAFLSFSLVASAVYLLNDLLDMSSDRQHHRKKYRPLAHGDLDLKLALSLCAALALGGFALGLMLPPLYLGLLTLYALSTTLYSFRLKRYQLLDVIVLASLYVLRILAGSAAIAVETTPWLLAFSLFFFLSLAYAKRFSELHHLKSGKTQRASGRAYRVEDMEQLAIFGSSSGYLSILVFILYLNLPGTSELYLHPLRLWLLGPVLLWWISRVWLLARRGEMDEDPLLFALKDRSSWVAGVLTCLILAAAL